MSYTKYRSTGIVIGGSNVGEASRIYNLFTRDFGLVRARAQGIRENNSKLKGHLQNLYLIDVHLVKGKSGWRITEAYKIKSFSNLFLPQKNKLQSLARVLLFLKRMLPEEDSNTQLFDIIIKGFDYLEYEGNERNIAGLEALMVLRTLRSLGYIEENEILSPLLLDNNYNQSLLIHTDNHRGKIIKEINQSIEMSDL